MHILLNDYGGYPFPIDLSQEWVRRGERVTHVYSSSSGSPQGRFPKDSDHFQSVDIRLSNAKANFVKRWRAESLYGREVSRLLREQHPDVVISANTPLEAQRQIIAACQKLGIRFVFWWQDVLSDAMDTILSRKFGPVGHVIGAYYSRIERRLLAGSDAIICIAPQFLERLKEWHIERPCEVIGNWAPIESLPMLSKDNEFSRQYELHNKFVVLYSGTLGMKQNPQILLDAAKYLRHQEDVRLLVLSNGVGMAHLKRQKAQLGLENLILLPLQPFERLPEILATGDVHLVLLHADAGEFCVPSKVWSAYCAGRPALLVMPKFNYAAILTEEIQAGCVLSNHEEKDLPSKILQLKNNPDLRVRLGHNGRIHAERNYPIKRIADRFNAVIHSL